MRLLSRIWLLAVLLLATVVGCTAAAEPHEAPGGEATHQLRVGLTEWTVETGGVRLTPGEVEVRVTNTGATVHDVVIHGTEGTWRTPVLAPGERHELQITTAAGEELELVCTLTGHDAAGMRTEVRVEGEAST